MDKAATRAVSRLLFRIMMVGNSLGEVWRASEDLVQPLAVSPEKLL